MINKQTTLDLNGPILSITTNPLAVSVGCTNSGIATFVGLATALFPTQTPSNSARSTGSISYQWYLENYGELTDGTIAEFGVTVAGSATTTLTLSNLYSAGIGTLAYVINPNLVTTNVYFTADYVPSAYGQDPITAGTARSTGNAINEPITSLNALITVNPNITISSYPEIATVPTGTGTNARFDITASTTDSKPNDLTYQWYANGISLSDGSNSIVVQSPNQTLTTTAPGFNGSGIYLDLTNSTGTIIVTITTSHESAVFHYLNIPGVANIPKTLGRGTYELQGGRIYGPCTAPYGNLYIGNETPVGGTQTLVVEEGGDDWNDMILSVDSGSFKRLTSAPIIKVIGTGLVNSTDTVTGAKTPNLTISCNTVGIQTVQCRVSHPTACNSPLYSNVVNFNVVAPRSILNIETFKETGTENATLTSLNLDESGSSITLDATNTLELTSLYAAEKDINVTMELYGAKGSDNGSFLGGPGGKSTISFTMKKNEEYVIARIPKLGENGGLFLYRKSTLLVVCGAGGNAGTRGNGAAGGGVITNIGVVGGGAGPFTTNGIFGSTSTVNAKDVAQGDTIATAPNGGRTITCSKGPYWTQKGFSPCADVGSVQFYRPDGSVIGNTATITRGFKAGYSILTTAGAGTNNGGNGGGGGVGGQGGISGLGGGGGSGYPGTDAIAKSFGVTVSSNSLGGNSGASKVVIRITK